MITRFGKGAEVVIHFKQPAKYDTNGYNTEQDLLMEAEFIAKDPLIRSLNIKPKYKWIQPKRFPIENIVGGKLNKGTLAIKSGVMRYPNTY